MIFSEMSPHAAPAMVSPAHRLPDQQVTDFFQLFQ
jgi:hypothetical protein